MEKIIYNRFLLVKDNFYSAPQKVLKQAEAATYYQPEHITGYRSTTVYHEEGIKKKLENLLGIKITRWDMDPLEENGVFYHGFSEGQKKEQPGVHSDEPYNDITILIYLKPGIPTECGTSLWKHKETGLTDPPNANDAKRLGMKVADIHELLIHDSRLRSKWIEIDRVGNQFNRMVAYPSGVFHSASRHYGSNMENGRIYQTLRVGVDWNSFRMKN